MKKTFFLILWAAIPSLASAQLLVNAQGNVGIGDSINAASNLAIGAAGTSNTSLYLGSNNTYGMMFNRGSNANYAGIFMWNYALPNSRTNGLCSINTNSGQEPNYGVYTSTVSGALGNKFGVYSGLYGSSGKGAAILGSSISTGTDLTMDDRYAGYFNGNVKVANGTINGTLVSDSDEGLKENIAQLDEQGGSTLDALARLTPVSYNYKQQEVVKSDKPYPFDIPEGMEGIDEEALAEYAKAVAEEVPNPVMEKTHFGFIAQELQQVYPELVYENGNGTLSVCYTELIPILVQAVKELSAKVDALTAAQATPMAATSQAVANDIAQAEAQGLPSLSQNVPNPFTDKTDIPVYLPETVKTATLCIYDLTGKQLEQHAVTGRGHTLMTIHADKMAPGMYLYSLIADGQLVTSKRMIVAR